MAWLRFDGRPQPVKEYGDALMADEFSELSLEKAVATTQTPRAESISLAEARRRGDFERYVECSVKVRLHPIGEGNLLCGQSHKFQFHLGIHRNSAPPRDVFAVELPILGLLVYGQALPLRFARLLRRKPLKVPTVFIIRANCGTAFLANGMQQGSADMV